MFRIMEQSGGLQTWKRDYLEAYDTDVQTILGIETGEIKWLVNILHTVFNLKRNSVFWTAKLYNLDQTKELITIKRAA